MKKLMILTAIAAMAFGAQASHVYTFSFELKNIPEQKDGHPDHDLFYLVANDTTVIAYVYRGDIIDQTGVTNGEMKKTKGTNWELTTNPTVHKAGSGSATGHTALNGKNVEAHELTAATIVKTASGGENDRTITITFTSDYSLTAHDNADWSYNNGNGGIPVDLKMVVTNAKYEDGDPNCVEYMYDDGFGLSRTSAGDSESYGLTGSAAYPVPEPTSAMLLLLGVAGLALKRKVA